MAEDYTLIDHNSKGRSLLVFPGTALMRKKKKKIGQLYMLFVFMFAHVGMC